jgi:hypothetical protein
MKKINYLFSSMLIAAFFMLTGMDCGGKVDPEKNTKQKAAEALSAVEWEAESVMSEGTDLMTLEGDAAQYTSFTMNFDADATNADIKGGTYSVTDGGYAFSDGASGNWEFVGEPTSASSFKIKRGSDVEMDVTVSATALTLEFDIPASASAKMNGTEGPIVFNLIPAAN